MSSANLSDSDTGTSSADYIQFWHGDANLLRESLEAVQQTAAVILGGIAPEDHGNSAWLNCMRSPRLTPSHIPVGQDMPTPWFRQKGK